MEKKHRTRRVVRHTHRIVHKFVRVLGGLTLLVLALVLMLGTIGVPKVVLREILRRVNEAGIPISVDHVKLSFGGWRAENVRYYSSNPDDLDPFIHAEKVVLRPRRTLFEEGPDGWRIAVEADEIHFSPLYEWRVDIPGKHKARYIDRAEAVLVFLPDRLQINDGRMEWLQTHIEVNGVILLDGLFKGADEPPGIQKERDPDRKALFTKEHLEALEEEISRLSLPSGVGVEVGFSYNPLSPHESRIELGFQAVNPEYSGVEFTGFELVASIAYPEIEIQHASLSRGDKSLEMACMFNLASNTVEGTMVNTVASQDVLKLLPEQLFAKMGEVGFDVDEIPYINMTFGPSRARDILNALSGSFSFNNLSYKDVHAIRIEGDFARKRGRLDIYNINAMMRGQEAIASEIGSAMRGGPVRGSVFWEEDSRSFGVKVDSSCDPNLIYNVLSPVRIATNIMHRFQFHGVPPDLHVELGSPITDWKQFYIDVSGTGTNFSFHGVECTAADVTSFYKHGVLRLEPAEIHKGGGSISGTASIDFKGKTATFDVVNTINPAEAERLIYPTLNLFEKHLQVVEEPVKMVGKGTYDWGTMEKTDFSGNLQAKRFKAPIGYADDLVADIMGKGQDITVSPAHFYQCGGVCSADFFVTLDQESGRMPYQIDLRMNQVDLFSYYHDLYPESSYKASGKLVANIHIESDFSTNFFATAKGHADLDVQDGQLADLPLFRGFSRLIRMVFAGFDVFSITDLSGEFNISDGQVSSEDVYFGGNLIGAEGQGLYDIETGYDAYIQAQILNKSFVAKVVGFVTYPLTKLLEIRLEGPFAEPSWSLKRFPDNVSKVFSSKKRKERKAEKKKEKEEKKKEEDETQTSD